MANNWTEEQKQAIDTRGSNLLVAAAAGAGKTAVLVERIIKIITEEKNHIDIDKMLVVTFTNAAAAEMRERIAAAIANLLYNNPNSKLLQRQLVLLNKAKITTIHSFCLDVIRNYFHLIDLDPKFRIADDTETILLKNETIEELFDEKYEEENKNEQFLRLVECYCSNRDDNMLIEIILSLYNFAKSSPQPEKWLRDMSEAFNVGEDYAFGNTLWAEALLSNMKIELMGTKKQAEKALKIISLEGSLEPYSININDDLCIINDLLLASDVSWNNFIFQLQEVKFGTLKRCGKEVDKEKKEQVQKIRDNYKKQIKKVQEDIVNSTGEDMISHLQELYPMMKTLGDLVIEFDNKFTVKKRARGIIDFNDFEHLALKILTENGEPSKAALELRERYEEILIDEYQDSNMVQEVILSSISRKESENPNVFMVGDVKQSIYKFRQAKPELFLDKYREYSEVEGAKNRKILLFKNFRSRENIIYGVNYIFNSIMSKNIGELDYDEKEELKLGAEFSEDNKDFFVGGATELHIIEKNKVEQDEIETEDSEEDIDNMKIEARVVAKRIKELVTISEKSFGVFDKNTKEYRGVQYKDIVILLRATEKWAPAFTEELKNFDVPVFADTGSGYFETTEIKTIVSLLQIIDNPLQDIPLIAVLRSPIAAFSEDELIDVRSIKITSTFFDALKLASKGYEKAYEQLKDSNDPIEINEGKTINGALGKKCFQFLQSLEGYNELSLYMPIDEFIWHIYMDTGYYGYAGAMPGGMQRQANLRILFQRAKAYENTSYKGLFNFINFLSKLKVSSKDMGSAKILGENENVVRIMSIHKSKGLEFPIVFLSGAGKNFNLRDMTKPILFHHDLGFGPDYVNLLRRVSYPTIFKNAIKNKIKLESLSEEMRILYVALTRAKEKLIITGCVKEIESSSVKWCEDIDNNESKVSENVILKGRNYLDWICPAIIKHEDGALLRDKANIDKEILTKDASSWKIVFWNRAEAVKTSDDSDFSKLISEDEKNAQGENKIQLLKRILSEIETNEPRTAYYEEINRRLSFEYRHSTASSLPSSISVTELKRQQAGEEENRNNLFKTALKKRPAFLEDKNDKGLTPAEKGTATHNVMQRLDYSLGLDETSIKEQINKMVVRELLTENQGKAVNVKRIARFFESELGKRIVASENVRREVPFVIKLKATEVYKDLPKDQYEDEHIMVQGAIDCYFEQEDGMVLVDYKTDYVTDDNFEVVVNKYKSQLKYYTKALEKITGKVVVEQYLYLFYNGAMVKM